ncbi:hypothetical protein K402DRAFT_411468 [Aulographum hederae CBS 113979]|uniref:Protein artemis n=1 Tax=Aulographum hederae CBS 113979 TaxID=1176131 RepID=A0A6G1H691_9PEZI|nr:hypothetical protein K402DRAFT_411468 [Aulographum hederae CBS 113979]
MSTFNGIVAEFPDIRIDYFRTRPDQKPPLACFLSHVHSDHLQGLETLKSPFVYCSPATREILLRLEKYPHRLNFAKNIVESRKQTYRHLKTLLKTLPLETPTLLELSPGCFIRVTLFDANHCAGAVMFLVQTPHSSPAGEKAILYTGDIRAETWWVNCLVRNPVLLPYTLGSKCLDNLYLDTTFATKSVPYRQFPSKAEGLKELISKIGQYPADTIFYIESWTFGYEDVWASLSAALGSPIHLDRYRWSLYKSLANASKDGVPEAREAAALMGFKCGNHHSTGCLTADAKVRLHSCERKTSHCSVMDDGTNHTVRIVPIISRLEDGAEIGELGLGGGQGDLDQIHELELNDPEAISKLLSLCTSTVKDGELLRKMFMMLNDALKGESSRLRLDALKEVDATGDAPLQRLVDSLIAAVGKDDDGKDDISLQRPASTLPHKSRPTLPLPQTITFPYSRHSSYDELCTLVKAFKPRDIHPCTVDETTWSPAVSMRSLFGHLCSGNHFFHDALMQNTYEERVREEERKEDDENPNHTETQLSLPQSEHLQSDQFERTFYSAVENKTPSIERRGYSSGTNLSSPPTGQTVNNLPQSLPPERTHLEVEASSPTSRLHPAKRSRLPSSEKTTISKVPSAGKNFRELTIREWAYHAATDIGDMNWFDVGGLTCVKHGTNEEEELGES